MTKTDFAELKEKLFKQSYTQTTAIISELIEIIKSQSETIDELNEEATLVRQREIAENSLSETTTRLQKLMGVNNV